MATLSPFAPSQFFDDNGDPLNGGTITTYVAGTSTLKTAYQDNAASVAHANPIVLDSAGRPPAAIWLSDGAYKFIVKDSAGVTVDTIDNLTGSNESQGVVNTIAELRALAKGRYSIVEVLGYHSANDGGGGLFYWDSISVASENAGTVILPNSNPANGRWRRLYSGAVNVRWFGARGDGATSDTTAIQACLNLGGHVYIPSGTFAASQLTMVSNTYLELDSKAILYYTGSLGSAGTECILLLRGISNVEINGNGGALLRGQLAGNSEFRMAIRLDETENIHIHDLLTEKTDGDGVYLGTSVNNLTSVNKDVVVERVTSTDHGRQGISIISGENVVIRECRWESIGLTSPAANGPWAGCDIEPDSDYAQLKNINIEDCVAYDCKGPGFMTHLPVIDGDQEAAKKIDLHFRRCRSYSCNESGFRVTSIISENVSVEVWDLQVEDSGLNGVQVGNVAVQSSVRFRGKTRLINNFTRTINSSASFPWWNSTGASANSDTKVDVLVYTNTVLSWETLNGGAGLIAGNVEFEDLEIRQDSIDINPFYADNYNQTDGAANGTIRFPIQNVVIKSLWLDTVANKLPTFTSAYSRDVRFDSIYTWDGTNYRWQEAKSSRTSNRTLSNDTDQGVIQDNTGASGLVVFTLPGAEAVSDHKQRFKVRVTDANGIQINPASGDSILLPAGAFVSSLVSYSAGAEILLEKYDVSTWLATRLIGNWSINNVIDVTDGDYSITRADHGRILTDANATANRTFSLPTGSASIVGLEVTIHNRSSSYRCIIDPAVGDSILLLETTSAGRIQAGDQGSTITLVYTGNNTWMSRGIIGPWYDIDATISNAHRQAGNRYFLARLMVAQGADIASANDITLGSDGMSFQITGTTTVNRIATSGWIAGAEVTLRFTGALTVADAVASGGGFASINLNGSANQAFTAGSLLKLRYNGTDWDEVSRMIN